MDYKEDTRKMSTKLLERLEQQIGILNDASMSVRHYVYQGYGRTTTLSKYDLFRQMKFLLKDMEFTTIFLEQELDEEEKHGKSDERIN